MHINLQFREISLHALTGLMLIFLSSVITLNAQPWSVQGSDIDGAEANDQMAYAMDVSSDGSIIISSSPNHDGPIMTSSGMGMVNVFQFNGFTWNPLGGGIYGERNQDMLGSSVSISANGDFIAMGAINSDGESDTDTDAGHVRVYQRASQFWVQMGAFFYGASAGDHFGQSVSLSANGTMLAVGAPNNDAGGTDAGQTTIYSLSGFTWTQVGSPINGLAAGDHSGYSVSLSEDGNVVAIGSYAADNSTPEEAGHVRVFVLDNGSWVQRGSALEGDDVNDNFGISVSLNEDGSIVSVGSSTHGNGTNNLGLARVFQWSGSAWSQMGSDIVGATNERLGASVSLDSDGNTLLVSAIGNGSTAGYMRVYEWISTNWVQQGLDMTGRAGFDGYAGGAQISGDGSVFVGGSSQNRGYVRVYGPCENIGIDTIEACDSYTWIDGLTYTASNNTATWTLTNEAGCDSVVTLDLTILESNTGIDEISACVSYTWIDGITYTSDNNTATWTLTNAAGCDSVVTLNLSIHQPNTGMDEIEACDSYTWIDGVTYTESNNSATHTLTNVFGCDSVVTLNLTILESNTGTDEIEACDSYTWIDGVTYTESNNSATFTLTNVAGCDSVVTLNLTILESNTGTDVIEACDSYTWIDGVTYTESNNTATHTLTNVAGCDSVVTLNLTILESNTGTDVIEACDSYTWIDGVTYTESNSTATHTLTNVAGCDSVVTLNLTILESNTGIDVIQSCIPYTWIDGVTYSTDNNTATFTLTNAAGCDSVVTLDLTIVDSYETTDYIHACDPYTWIDGNTYTESNNTASITLTSTAGCDSLVHLDLTMGQNNTGTDVISACDSYTWIDGVTYTADNNTATWTLTNVSGCDSVITLNLTILQSTAGTDIQTVCDSLVWIDGITYKESNNTATHTLSNAVGCDSVVTLNLTVLKSTESTIDVESQDSYTSPSGKIFTQSGTYMDTIANAVGCDSVITIQLTVRITGIGEHGDNHQVKYYPNPVDQELHLEFEKAFSGTLELLDMNGRVLIQQKRSYKLRTTLNTSSLLPGAYLLKMTSDQDQYLLRIIKH